MTQTFAVNQNNDMYLDQNGNIAMISGQDAVMQACQQAAQTLLGEMVLLTSDGIPYFQVVFNGVPNLQQLNASLRTAFLGVTGVTQVQSLDISQTGANGQSLSYTAVIATIYGSSQISGVING